MRLAIRRIDSPVINPGMINGIKQICSMIRLPGKKNRLIPNAREVPMTKVRGMTPVATRKLFLVERTPLKELFVYQVAQIRNEKKNFNYRSWRSCQIMH